MSSGRIAETVAAEWLCQHGWSVVGRNVVIGRVEIDIIAKRRSSWIWHSYRYCLIEVKYRQTLAAGRGGEYITKDKLSRLRRAHRSYLPTLGSRDRLDIGFMTFYSSDYVLDQVNLQLVFDEVIE